MDSLGVGAFPDGLVEEVLGRFAAVTELEDPAGNVGLVGGIREDTGDVLVSEEALEFPLLAVISHAGPLGEVAAGPGAVGLEGVVLVGADNLGQVAVGVVGEAPGVAPLVGVGLQVTVVTEREHPVALLFAFLDILGGPHLVCPGESPGALAFVAVDEGHLAVVVIREDVLVPLVAAHGQALDNLRLFLVVLLAGGESQADNGEHGKSNDEFFHNVFGLNG